VDRVEIVVLTAPTADGSASRVLPALDLLAHPTRVGEASDPGSTHDCDVVLVDARRRLVEARGVCQRLRSTGLRVPLLVVVEEAGLAAISDSWGIDGFLLADAGPAETDMRLRIATQAAHAEADATYAPIGTGALTIDPATYAVQLKGKPLDLTYKEFELIRFLAQHPGRVFTRDQLLREVWGYDYFGGPRTVDVHVRRLRAKLGSEYESMIGTVRQVGYKFVLSPARSGGPAVPAPPTVQIPAQVSAAMRG
jgi:DNA-binding response OmpR family regulator